MTDLLPLLAAPAQVAPLRPPPALEHYLFEQPIPLALGLIAAGIAARVLLARQGRDRAGRAVGWLGLALGFAAYFAASFIATPRERLQRATRDLVRAGATPEPTALSGLLEPKVSLGFGELRSSPFVREAFVALVERVHSRLELSDWSIGDLETEILAPGVGRTQARVRVEPRQWYPAVTWWRIDWRKDPSTGEWRAEALTCLLINGAQPSQDALNFVTRP